MSHTTGMPIGEVAAHTGVASSALRYYERLGLLPTAERVGGQRRYSRESVEQVALISLYRDAGFTLAEIRTMQTTAPPDSPAWGALARRKLSELDSRIADAQQARQLLEHALQCPEKDLAACPNFRSEVTARLLGGAHAGGDR